MIAQTKRQISTGEIKRFTIQYATNQQYKCAICGDPLQIGRIALDHCHTTGNLRGALCTTCNTGEGKVRAGARYMARTDHLSKTDYLEYLRRLIAYLERTEAYPSGFIHPSYDMVAGKQKPKKRPKRRIRRK